MKTTEEIIHHLMEIIRETSFDEENIRFKLSDHALSDFSRLTLESEITSNRRREEFCKGLIEWIKKI